MYYKLTIDETGCSCPRLQDTTQFNVIVETFKTLPEIEKYIIDRYGKMPSKKRKVYIDTKTEPNKEIGFLYSFWNKDWSHNSKSWWQTDWITILKVCTKPILL